MAICYLLNIAEGRFLRNVRNFISQQLARTLACVVQFVPHVTKHHAIRLVERDLLPELCTNSISSSRKSD
jgi:hypothetical protein